MEMDATQKLELFRQAFFPPPPEVDLEDTKDHIYPDLLHFPPITLDKVIEAIQRMPGNKAPGKDTIPSHLMRKGKMRLRHHLYQRGVPDVPDGDCRCGKAIQTVQHVLLACPLFKDLREQFLGRLGGGLEGGGNLRVILNTPKLAIRAAKFMLRTRLLGQFGAVNEDQIS